MVVFRRWIGWSLRLISLSMAVLGCQSGNALRRFAKSFAKKCATRSFAIKSRNAQGIFFFDNRKERIEEKVWSVSVTSCGGTIRSVATT